MKVEKVAQSYQGSKQLVTMTITIADIAPRIRRLEMLIEEFYEAEEERDYDSEFNVPAIRAGDFAGVLITNNLESGFLNYQVDWAGLTRKEE